VKKFVAVRIRGTNHIADKLTVQTRPIVPARLGVSIQGREFFYGRPGR
jgi:hypothetical protein